MCSAVQCSENGNAEECTRQTKKNVGSSESAVLESRGSEKKADDSTHIHHFSLFYRGTDSMLDLKNSDSTPKSDWESVNRKLLNGSWRAIKSQRMGWLHREQLSFFSVPTVGY